MGLLIPAQLAAREVKWYYSVYSWKILEMSLIPVIGLSSHVWFLFFFLFFQQEKKRKNCSFLHPLNQTPYN